MNKIKYFRQKQKLTVRQLAEKAGIAVGYLSDLENHNRNNPSKKTMENISKALGKSVLDIFYPEEKKEKEVC